MNAFKRAWRYITRKPTKSILLTITFFVIGNLVILGLGISQAADNAKVLTRKQMRAVVSYETDYDAYYQYVDSLTDQDEIDNAYKNYPKLSADTAKKLASDERVKAVNYLTTNTMYSRDFDNVPLGNENQNNSMSVGFDENGNEITYTDPNIMAYGNLYTNMIEMEEGTFTLVDGRYYTQDDIDNANKVVCITKELADQNGFKVGDSISITSVGAYEKSTYIDAGMSEDDLYLTLEIVGIYSTTNDVNPNDQRFGWMAPYESPKNIVLLPYTTLSEYILGLNNKYFEILKEQNPEVYGDLEVQQEIQPSTVVFLLDDPLNVDSFVSDHESDLSEYTKLDANNDTFKKLARPLDTMSFFSNIVVWIVVVNAVVIISLVTALTLKTREYEIGVLLSLGVSKVKVILQLFLELIAIAALGFLLAVGSGSLIAGRVGEAVLSYQTASDAQYETDDNSNTYYWSSTTDYFTEVTQDDLLSQYHVSVSAPLVLEIYVIGAVVVLIAILIPSFMIMRLNPKQILLETN